MTAEKTVTVTSEMTVGHFVANMLRVYATPMMILLMEMPSAPRSPRICRRASSASAWT
jgi:predicted thioesterase